MQTTANTTPKTTPKINPTAPPKKLNAKGVPMPPMAASMPKITGPINNETNAANIKEINKDPIHNNAFEKIQIHLTIPTLKEILHVIEWILARLAFRIFTAPEKLTIPHVRIKLRPSS
ncbi:19815_t:CDS:2 [Racocetra fulgida]|uniref:19815_t:CDS:1 n=1 Tax=Racocetra fulgida TaxID=60492 RepID=A0A9N8ZTS1_9GLOM|nr:19815_t:CDS:2 [Racocetra fulgida]